MKNNLLPFLHTLVSLLLLAACVREVDYKRDETDKTALVVNGGFYDNQGPFFLRLSHPTDYDKRDFEPETGATVSLTDDQGQEYFYQETDTGVYELNGVRGVPGRTYTLHIRLADGTMYRAHPQKMPMPLPIDSAELRVEFMEDVTAQGNIVRFPVALIYGWSTAPDHSEGQYLRWDSESTYIFSEIYTGAPFDEQKQCFLTDKISNQLVSIADPSEVQAGGRMEALAGRRKVDYSFEFRNCFSVYQRTIGKEAYDYWTRVKQVTEPSGTIFDPPPALIRGNVENLNAPEHPALGFFEVGASDTARYCANRSDLPFDIVAFIPQYCNGNLQSKPECIDCILLPNSSWQKPDWW